jgi:predicted transcriptional regulator
MTTREHELTEAEWDIIEVVWEHEPCAAPTVQEELAARKKWTYST